MKPQSLTTIPSKCTLNPTLGQVKLLMDVPKKSPSKIARMEKSHATWSQASRVSQSVASTGADCIVSADVETYLWGWKAKKILCDNEYFLFRQDEVFGNLSKQQVSRVKRICRSWSCWHKLPYFRADWWCGSERFVRQRVLCETDRWWGYGAWESIWTCIIERQDFDIPLHPV